jgi:hypothetical protein
MAVLAMDDTVVLVADEDVPARQLNLNDLLHQAGHHGVDFINMFRPFLMNMGGLFDGGEEQVDEDDGDEEEDDDDDDEEDDDDDDDEDEELHWCDGCQDYH